MDTIKESRAEFARGLLKEFNRIRSRKRMMKIRSIFLNKNRRKS
jgi:hypothetical protein